MGVSSDAPSLGVYFELIEISFTLASVYNITILDLFNHDADEVIMLLNYTILKSKNSKPSTQNGTKSKETRILVNDATATGGWY